MLQKCWIRPDFVWIHTHHPNCTRVCLYRYWSPPCWSTASLHHSPSPQGSSQSRRRGHQSRELPTPKLVFLCPEYPDSLLSLPWMGKDCMKNWNWTWKGDNYICGKDFSFWLSSTIFNFAAPLPLKTELVKAHDNNKDLLSELMNISLLKCPILIT